MVIWGLSHKRNLRIDRKLGYKLNLSISTELRHKKITCKDHKMDLESWVISFKPIPIRPRKSLIQGTAHNLSHHRKKKEIPLVVRLNYLLIIFITKNNELTLWLPIMHSNAVCSCVKVYYFCKVNLSETSWSADIFGS